MKSIPVTLSLLLCIVSFTPLFAQSLISKVPAEGVWSTYTAVFENVPAQGNTQKSESTVTVRALGTHKTDSGTLRWIEIERELENDKSWVMKFLIAESDIGTTASPLLHIQKLWHHRPEMKEAHEINVKGDTPLEPYLSPEIPTRNTLEKKKITGDLNCDGISGTCHREQKRGASNMQIDATYTEYHHEKAPFGSVYFSSEIGVSVDGKPLGTRKLALTLKESGDNATSALPENQ